MSVLTKMLFIMQGNVLELGLRLCYVDLMSNLAL